MSGTAGGAPGAGNNNEACRDRASRPFDPGLQPERTALAWRRTALALVIVAVVGLRVLPALLGPLALVGAGAGIAIASAVFVASHRRYRSQHRLLTTAGTPRTVLLDGRLPGLMALTATLAGLAAAAVIASVNML
ncbi:DUF202 domain-containing protein [Arthrobacter sp. MPF02]|uniref:DUF202 domain-containing protein n=1 Tax=Arthrobacter sp. MPF02 TaxID=3388492 RepID=UPI003985301D